MKIFVILAVLSLGLQTWASVPVGLSKQNRDPPVVWNVFVPEDMYDSLHSDKEDLEESDVYWRPWKGTMPKDAVIGAYVKTNCGSDTPIYMAQVLHKASSGILPAQMFKKSKAAIVSYGKKEFRCKENIQILCAEDSSILTWVPINETKNLNLTANKDCVIAGTELTFNIFFGRTNYEDETVIGKVLYHSNTMYFPYYGEEKYLTKDFEILCYKKAVETRRTEAIRRKLEEEKQKKEETEAIRRKLKQGEPEKEVTTEVTITSTTTEAVKQDQVKGTDRSVPTSPSLYDRHYMLRFG